MNTQYSLIISYDFFNDVNLKIDIVIGYGDNIFKYTFLFKDKRAVNDLINEIKIFSVESNTERILIRNYNEITNPKIQNDFDLWENLIGFDDYKFHILNALENALIFLQINNFEIYKENLLREGVDFIHNFGIRLGTSDNFYDSRNGFCFLNFLVDSKTNNSSDIRFVDSGTIKNIELCMLGEINQFTFLIQDVLAYETYFLVGKERTEYYGVRNDDEDLMLSKAPKAFEIPTRLFLLTLKNYLLFIENNSINKFNYHQNYL